VITASAAIDTGAFSLSSTFTDPGYCEEYGKKVFNFSDQSGPESFGTLSLLTAIQNSVNSVFCNIGKQIGALKILDYAERYGFYSKPPVELPIDERKASGLYKNGRLWRPTEPNAVDPGRLAFGQVELQVTPIQMAMVAATIANDGVLMKPYLVERIVAPDGNPVATTEPERLGRAVKASTANAVTQGMIAAVQAGTSTAAQIPGVTVAGKTGTAESGVSHVNTTGFICFAPAENPRVAIAVFLEQQNGVGGTTAAPIAKQVMEALLAERRN
jgi:peptidoglycan glycosyltransferase